MQNPNPMTPIDLQERVHTALSHWHSDMTGASPLSPLLLFQQLLREGSGDSHQATNQLLLQALHVLGEKHKQDELLLRRSYLNKEKEERIANALNISTSTFYRRKPEAERKLTNVLLEMENTAHITRRTLLLQRLMPPTYTQLLGIDEHLERLDALLTAPESPWIVALAGMGGIGKTSLADATVRRLLECGAIAEVGWVTARQTDLGWDSSLRPVTEPALTFDALVESLTTQLAGEIVAGRSLEERHTFLRERLKEQPHVVVIDNLETVADVEALVTALSALAMPSKFLLTSRENLYMHPAIYHYPVPELSAENAVRLIRQEARQRNLETLLQASDEAMHAVVAVVGGNPLAIRLVTGQIHVYTLEVVLDNLRQAQGTHIENLYTYLYRGAWDRLDELTRRALVAMPLTPVTGANLTYLAQISGFQINELMQAMEVLVRLNLVDVHGDLHQRRYAIHNLTRSFLHEQVLRWQ